MTNGREHKCTYCAMELRFRIVNCVVLFRGVVSIEVDNKDVDSLTVGTGEHDDVQQRFRACSPAKSRVRGMSVVIGAWSVLSDTNFLAECKVKCVIPSLTRFHSTFLGPHACPSAQVSSYANKADTPLVQITVRRRTGSTKT